jgi:hypothetical protein
MFSANSHLSLKASTDPAPLQLFGYLYDVPKCAKVDDLRQPFLDNYIDCTIQIKVQAKRPLDTAMVKFQNSVHL